jgi:MFS family permease
LRKLIFLLTEYEVHFKNTSRRFEMIGRFLNSNKNPMGPATDMRAFSVLWLGQCVSFICSGMTCFAQSIYAYTTLGGTITNMAILVALAQVPGIVISPIAGLVADRWNRRWVMFTCNSIAACTTLVLRSMVLDHSIQIWHLYILVTIIATANAFQWPSYFATVPMMVPFKQLGRANGMVWSARTLSEVAAPAIAAWLVHSIKLEGIVLFDTASYLLAATILLCVFIPPTPINLAKEVGQKPSLLKEAFSGWSYILARPGLKSIMVLFGAANFVYAATRILVLPLALTISSVAKYGMLITLGGICAVAGSFVITLWGGPKKRIYGVLGALALDALGLIVVGVRPGMMLMFIGFGLVAFMTPFVNTFSGIIWQSKVPINMQGRVMAASGVITTSSFQLGNLLTGLVADAVFVGLLIPGTAMAALLGPIMGTGKGAGLGLMFMIMGIIQLVFVIGGFLYPRLRRVDIELPDAVVAYAEAEAEKQGVGTAWRQIDLTRAGA